VSGLPHDKAARLTAIKGSRAVTDPVVVHKPALASDEYGLSETMREAIHQERIKNGLETPTDEPIRKVGWAETCVLFSSLSLVQKPPADVRRMYQWTFRKLNVETFGRSGDDLPEQARSAAPLPEHLKPRLEDTRQAIKIARDEYYLANHYDSEHCVPKRFWTEYHTGPASREAMDPVDYEPAFDF